MPSPDPHIPPPNPRASAPDAPPPPDAPPDAPPPPPPETPPSDSPPPEASRPPRLDEVHRAVLLRLARQSIALGLTHGNPPAAATLLHGQEHQDPQLHQRRSAFVTLRVSDDLRGCIGSLDAARRLVDEVVHNAFAAAFHDPRFAPLSREELPRVRIHISVLTAPTPLPVAGEDDLLQKLRVGIDGLSLRDAATGRAATFIPAVWEHCGSPALFLQQLKRKAGLPDAPGHWRDSYRAQVYQAESFEEPDAAAIAP